MPKALRIFFESDWHIGSGAGIPGGVDRMVVRDWEGFPFIPGKTLTGILRDSAEFVASTRDVLEGGRHWHEVLVSLFGNQTTNEDEPASQAKIGIGSGSFSPEMKNYLRSEKEVTPYLFMLQPGVKIDRKTGRALEGHLYSREEVRGGCAMYADLTTRKALSSDEEKLFLDSVKAVRRIGGKRRRGGGRCTLSIIERGACDDSPVSFDLMSLRNADRSMELDFMVETLEPVIVSKTVLGNVVQSESFIPGTFLLPFFSGKLSKILGPDKTLEAVLNGDFSVGPFYPEVEGEKSYPIPFSYSREKDGDGKTVVNRLVESAERERQMKDIRRGFIAPKNDKVLLDFVGSKFVSRTHNTIDDEKQRPTSDVGGFFTYQAIVPGMRFQGSIRISRSLWGEIRRSSEKLFTLGGRHHALIGRSCKDEYGRVEISCVGEAKYETCSRDLLKGKYLLAYLASDLLNRRPESLSFSAGVDEFRDSLSELLEVELSFVEEFGKNAGSDLDQNPLGGDRGNCVRYGRRESWHTKWGLPRPSLVYLQAGSVFLFEVKDPREWSNIDWPAVDAALFAGLGERRAEGYGRILLNPSFMCDCSTEVHVSEALPKEKKNVGRKTQLEKEDLEFLGAVERGFYKENYRICAKAYVASQLKKAEASGKIFGDEFYKRDLSWRKGNCPSSSQFGKLRGLAAFITDSGDVSAVGKWLDSLEKRREVRKIWSDEWRRWVKDMIEGEADPWAIMQTSRVGNENRLREEYRSFAVRVFLEVFCEAVLDQKDRGGC